MGKSKGFFWKVASRPLEAIEALVASVLFLSGLWLCSPFYEPTTTSAHQITGNPAVPMVLGIIQIVIGFVLFYALARIDWPRRRTVRSVVTYIVFLLFLFYAFSGILLYGLHRITWISTLSLALISGVAHLCLKVRDDGRR